ncbi:N-acetylglucosamine-6-phosphate deacetylase [Acidipila rosea]|uniref:N-acetylglucosamine 6-phosphate deacetylase n=1 Tax=Acidipila rosea TaxID=768535 RepID=A0A4R1L665_9BACT|nr:N-acetylglucosamine-6-phosphate deacetylase [Acidipila rosea]TCK71769.1 N-acetylglucosamine 6-phosphate deacetylase [Acidipila rosea]
MRTILTAEKLCTETETLARPVVILEDGVILSIESQQAAELPPGERLDFPGATLAPAFFDVHIHGSAGRDVMDASEDALTVIGRFLAQRGVGAYLATTVSAPLDKLLHSLEGLAKLMQQDIPGAKPLGIHLEGPFLSHARRGAHATADLLTPTAALFDRMWQASNGTLRLMTIAPELPGAEEVISRAVAVGVRVSLGHSDADTAAARRGVKLGAASATHTFNAMRKLDQRDPGILGVALTEDNLFAEIICDGLHVDPAMVKLFLRAKSADRGILVTDAMSATGMPDGSYKLGELEVRVVNGRCIIGEDTLAGSTLTLDRAVRNFTAFTGAPLETALLLASRNPARMTGFEGQVGSLAPGRIADIAVLSPSGEVITTLLRGRPVAA